MKVLNLIVLTLIVLSSNISTASMLIRESVSVTNRPGYLNVSDLSLQLESGETICAEIVEVKKAYLCIPSQKLKMNKTFTRIGFFWGSARGVAAGTLIPNTSSLLERYNNLITGHNLPGVVILNFLRIADLSKDSEIRLNFEERDFKNFFTSNPRIQSLDGEFYLISVAADDSGNFKKTLTHEIHHARFYLQPTLKNSIIRFWQENVSKEDKSNIRKILGQAYNADNELLIIDEFQAYLLQTTLSENPLSAYIESYRAELIKTLEEEVNYQELEIK